MKLIVLALTLATVAASIDTADPHYHKFASFMKKYNRRYASQSEMRGRFEIFKDNLALIAKRNARGGLDKHGINQFTDVHPNEFKSQYMGLKPATQTPFHAKKLQFSNASLDALQSIDWRTRGAVTPVKNQGQCGSCWAFSTTQQIESESFLATGVLPVLAPQQIVSCDTVDAGCNGGNPINGYAYVNSAGGIEYSKDYPYTSGTTQEDGSCKFTSGDLAPNTKPTTYSIVSQEASEESNMYSQIQKSPMSICVDATIWQTYVSGIITTASQCGTSIDHAVQVVGLNAEAKNPYWIVRNSWTAQWGEEGYIYVEAGHNVCGITTEATITGGE